MTVSEIHDLLRRAYEREARLLTDMEAVQDEIAVANQTLDAIKDVRPQPPSDVLALLQAQYSVRRAYTDLGRLIGQDETVRLLRLRLDTECTAITRRVAELQPALPFANVVRRLG